MPKIIALFDSHQDMSAAIEAFSERDWDKLDFEVIDSVDRPHVGDPYRVKMAPPVPGEDAALHTPATFAGSADALSPLGLSDSEKNYFLRGVQQGGVLLVVDTNNADAPAVRQTLEEAGGLAMSS
jgi:hypothetical protein